MLRGLFETKCEFQTNQRWSSGLEISTTQVYVETTGTLKVSTLLSGNLKSYHHIKKNLASPCCFEFAFGRHEQPTSFTQPKTSAK
eukprot:g69223.t1